MCNDIQKLLKGPLINFDNLQKGTLERYRDIVLQAQERGVISFGMLHKNHIGELNDIWQCSECVYVWCARTRTIKAGHGCPLCGAKKKAASKSISLIDYYNKIIELQPNWVIHSFCEADNSSSNSWFYCSYICTICNVDTNAQINNILQGRGCNYCGNKERGKKQEVPFIDYIIEIKKLHQNNLEILYITPGQNIDNISNSSIKLLCRCKVCNIKNSSKIYHLKEGKSIKCKCNDSKGEKQIRKVLEKYNINFEFQKEFDGLENEQNLSYDFYLPEYNICLEAQGGQHYDFIHEHFHKLGYEKFLRQQYHDELKRLFCRIHGILLIELPENRYNDVEEFLKQHLFPHIFN